MALRRAEHLVRRKEPTLKKIIHQPIIVQPHTTDTAMLQTMPMAILSVILQQLMMYIEQVKISRPTINLSINKNVQNVMITPMSYGST